jgi:phosphate transport system substrate-binding protein
MQANRGFGIAMGLAAVVLCGAGTRALGAEVTLRTKGGEFSVIGELQSFTDGRYTIISKTLGLMTLDAARFDCVGTGCPGAAARTATTATTTTPATAAPVRGAPATIVSIAGSNTIGNQLMPALIQEYAARNKLSAVTTVGANPLDMQFKLDGTGADAGTVELHRFGSSTAFKDLEAKTAVIGMSSRAIKKEEADKLAASGLGNLRAPGSEHILGLDGLQILVAPENGLRSITLDDAAKIFAGQITDWSALGLPAGKINVYAPTPDSGTFETFDQIVLKPRKLDVVATAKRTENHAEQSDWVARDRNGIGFAGVAYQRNAKPVNVQLNCGLIAVPSVFSMKTEEYPLSRRLFLYTSGEPRQPLARNLLAFALSPQAQPIIKQNDFIDQAPEFIDYEAQSSRIASAYNAPADDFDANLMRNLVSDLKGAQRLSVTFRFQTASFVLDNKALADAARLNDILQTPEMKGKTVLLLGFADSRGTFSNNLQLSERRAQAVLTALQARGNRTAAGSRPSIKAYSELAPVACNDAEDGLQLNRRVEVWVR